MDTGIYSAEFSRMTYDKMFTEAGHVLSEGGSVIIDASFIKAEERLKARKLSEDAHADFLIVECILNEEIVRQRLTERLTQVSASDGRWEILEPQKKRFEPIQEVPPAKHVIIDTSKPLEKQIGEAMSRIP